MFRQKYICDQSEVTDINKQKFLAELGKLLTFMYDEDRQDALAMYERMFDSAPDEQVLIQFLISPTRQAVVIARAYNARERKLQVNTTSRDELYDEQEGTPDYVRAISALEEEALGRKIILPDVPEDQFTLFADGIHPVESDAVEVEEETGVEVVVPDVESETEDAGGEEPADAAAETERGTDEPAAESRSVELEGEMDGVDAFLSDFSIAGDELGDNAGGEPAAKDAPMPVVPDAGGKEPEFVFDAGNRRAPQQTPPRPKKQNVQTDRTASAVELTERRAIVPLLILYILVAIPVVALCVLVLLVPTLFFLAMSIGAVVLGCMALSSAFGAFTIFADVMVVLGAALVVLALGLLFLWIFVWFVGGAIAGLINEIIKLGGRWCFKEVSAA